jgi:hypothetical protein
LTDPDPDPAAEIDGDVYVFPRYLAGSTYTGDPALEPLMALGWELTHDDLGIMWNHRCQAPRVFKQVLDAQGWHLETGGELQLQPFNCNNPQHDARRLVPNS